MGSASCSPGYLSTQHSVISSDGKMKFGKTKNKKETLENDDKFNDVENNNYCRKDSRANLIVTGLEACRPDTFLNPSLTSLTLVDPVFDFQFRIILVGESTVGKTSLLRSLTKSSFWAGEEATVGVDFVARNTRLGATRSSCTCGTLLGRRGSDSSLVLTT